MTTAADDTRTLAQVRESESRLLALLDDHRRALAQAAEREQFFSLSLDMLGIASANGYFKHVSPSFEQTLGFTAAEFATNPFMDFVHPDDAAATLAEVANLAAGMPTIRFENRYRCKDGSYK